MVERLGRLSDLELWRDMRASKSEGAHFCRRARVSQPNASGLRLARRIFCGRLSRYKLRGISMVTRLSMEFAPRRLFGECTLNALKAEL